MDVVDIIKGGIALLAFTLAFYALMARERKTPYITESVYPPILFVLVVIIVALLSIMTKSSSQKIAYISNILQLMSGVLLLLAVLFVAYRILRIHNRHMYFRDDQLIRNTFIVRSIRSLWRSISENPGYEHTPVGIPDEIVASVGSNCNLLPKEQLQRAIANNFSGKTKLSLSLVYKTKSMHKTNFMSTQLAISFLENGAYVQYTSIARHPVEFILQLKKAWENERTGGSSKSWPEVARNIVAVDAYTPHFGFIDTTHVEWTKRLRREDIGVECLTSRSSFAGIHTSTAGAFNVIKKRRQGESVRLPILVIYEGPYAIVDLESIEQYRIFIRHLLPSEKIWGGMFTCLIETAISENELNLLKSYADIVVDDTSES